mgnify:FL=1
MNRTRLSRVAITLIALLIAVSSVLFTGCGTQKDPNKIYVGMECGYAPFNYTQIDDANGAVEISNAEGYANGYDIMIAKKIAEEAGKELVVVKYEWDALVNAVYSGTLDFIIAGMSPTEERKQTIDFSDAYYESQLVIVVRKDSKYAEAKNLDDFNGAKIVAQIGTFHDQVLKEQAAEHGITRKTPLETFPAMINALKTATAEYDGYVAEEPGAKSDCSSNHDLTYVKLINNDTGFKADAGDVQIAVGLKKNSPYKAVINRALAKIDQTERDSMLDKATELSVGDNIYEDTEEVGLFAAMGNILKRYWSWLLGGVGYTLLVSLIGTVIGLFIGILIGMYRTMPDPSATKTSGKVLRVLKKVGDWILSAYIEIFRGTPMMVQAMVIFWGFALLNGGQTLNVVVSGLFIVSINTGAYMAEIVRGGIISISKGQFEGAHAIGMTHTQTMMNVVMPQALRNILPSVANEFVINIKDTSVLNVIGFTELFFQAKTIVSGNANTFATYLLVAAIYFILTFTITRILRLVEKKMDGKKNYTIQGSQNMDAESFVKEQSIEGGNADA